MIDIDHSRFSVTEITLSMKFKMAAAIRLLLLIKFEMAAVAILNLDLGHISVSNEYICVKIGVRTDIGDSRVTIAGYPTFGKIQDGGCRHLEFGFFVIWIFGHISVTNEHICIIIVPRLILAIQELLWPNISHF